MPCSVSGANFSARLNRSLPLQTADRSNGVARRRLVRREGAVRVVGGAFDVIDKWRRELRQWRRKMKFQARDQMEETKKQLMGNPVAFSVVRLLLFLQQLVEPIVWLRSNIKDSLEQFAVGYDKFCLEETKRMWQSTTELKKEQTLWFQTVQFMQVFFWNCFYQVFLPLSFLRGIVAPLFVGYFMYDRWLHSPMATGVVFMVIFKYSYGTIFSWW